GRLPLSRQARRDSEPQQPDFAGRAIREHIGRLDVLVDHPALVERAECGGETRAVRKNKGHSMGPPTRRSRSSPPGSSSTSVGCPRSRDNARLRTAHAELSASRKEYSCSILLMVSSAGRVETGASRRTDGTSVPPRCEPR